VTPHRYLVPSPDDIIWLALSVVTPLAFVGALMIVPLPSIVVVACHTRFKDKTECIAICMPGSSFIYIETL
jgi:hypothetical protein